MCARAVHGAFGLRLAVARAIDLDDAAKDEFAPVLGARS